jgi:hypothetical protein
MREDLGLEPGRALESRGDVPGSGKELASLAERQLVEAVHRAAERTILGGFVELAELCAVELVCLPELVKQPHDLVGVPDDVGGELRRDYEVDRSAVSLFEVDQPPEKGLREHPFSWIPLERNRDELSRVVPFPQLVNESLADDLGASADEGHLRRADGDPHLRAMIA